MSTHFSEKYRQRKTLIHSNKLLYQVMSKNNIVKLKKKITVLSIYTTPWQTLISEFTHLTDVFIPNFILNLLGTYFSRMLKCIFIFQFCHDLFKNEYMILFNVS